MAIAEQHPQDVFRSYPIANPQGGLATQAQVNFACDLFFKKNLFADAKFFDRVNAMDEGEFTQYLIQIRDSLPRLTKQRVSQIIDSLKPLPKREATAATTSGDESWSVTTINDGYDKIAFAMTGGDGKRVPRGSYAVHGGELRWQTTNELLFFSVWISNDGSRWSVKMYSSDELVPLRRAQQYEVLEVIARNPAACAERYGLEIGKCGICHRTLTNDVSRARGIGPICAERFGW